MRYPVLETEHLFLRKPGLADFAADAMPAPGAWATPARVLHHWDSLGYGPFAVVCKDSGAVLGLAGPWLPEGWPEAELVWQMRTRPDLTVEAAAAALTFAQTGLGWRVCVSYVCFPNRDAIAVAQSLGATRDRHAETPLGRDCLVYRHLDTARLRRAA